MRGFVSATNLANLQPERPREHQAVSQAFPIYSKCHELSFADDFNGNITPGAAKYHQYLKMRLSGPRRQVLEPSRVHRFDTLKVLKLGVVRPLLVYSNKP